MTRPWITVGRYWSRSIRHQLAFSFAFAAAALMLGFGYLLLDQQRELQRTQDVQDATHLAQILAAASATRLANNDHAGLQEVIRGIGAVNELKLALVQNRRGEIVASTQTDQVGSLQVDLVGLKLQEAAASVQVLAESSDLMDIAAPIVADAKLVGWVRVQMTRESANADLLMLKWLGVGFVVLAVALSVTVALILARRLTRGLNELMHVVAQVQAGNDGLRARVEVQDEIGVLAQHINRMLDALVDQKASLSGRSQELVLLNQILQDISRGVRLSHLLEALAHQVEALHPKLMCAIYLLDDESHSLRLAAAPGVPIALAQAMDHIRIGEGMGSSGTAAFRGKRVVVEDISTHPYWGRSRDLAQQAGIQSCWAQPIRSRDLAVLGTITLFQMRAGAPTEAEMVLIERCAQVTALAIERDRAQADLRVAATTFESQEGKAVTDANRMYIKVNKAFTRITGYPEEEAIGQNTMLLNSGLHDATFYDDMRSSLQNQGGWQGEIWHKRKNGEIYPEWLTITAVADEHGRVTNYVASFSDVSERKAAEIEIENLAYYDPLTQLPNRRMLLDRLQQAIAGSERSRRNGALLLIDLDNFKTLNDTHGHDKGDLLLQQVAQRLNSCVRDGDTVARLGGDEFVVMLKDLSESRVEAAAQVEAVGAKILSTLSQPYALGAIEQHSSASVGATLFCGAQDGTDELLKRSDLALYQAKGEGRNVMRFFDPEMQAAVTARADMEVDLREALQQHQFALHYQPQVDASGRMFGAEALVRWRHPKRGLVSPHQFIPLAEETALILPLGHWVLKTACQQLALWAQEPHTAGLTLAVNVSARQFHQRDFEEEVLDLLDSTGAPANRLKLELTESLLVSDIEGMIAKMSALKRWGVGFALDDFGTGYSSLSYLKRLPLDQLKIDQTFVRDSLTDPNDATIARTIVALGQSLGLSVIAEGVETAAQRDFLEDAGCLQYQGYLFGRPGPAASLTPLLDALRAMA